MVSVCQWQIADFAQGLFDGPDIESVHHLLAIVKHNQRHDVALPVLLPFLVVATVVLDIARLEGQSKCGEIPFRLGTVASAVGNVQHNPFLGRDGKGRWHRGGWCSQAAGKRKQGGDEKASDD